MISSFLGKSTIKWRHDQAVNWDGKNQLKQDKGVNVHCIFSRTNARLLCFINNFEIMDHWDLLDSAESKTLFFIPAKSAKSLHPESR